MTSLTTLRRAGWAALLAAGAASAQGQAASAAASGAVPAASTASAAAATDDPYLWLEQVDSPRAMSWVRAENEKTLGVLEKDPRFANFREQALAIAQTRDRIPFPSQVDGRIFNFWQDADHVRGIWRAAAQSSYDAGGTPAWTTVLDLDQLARTEHANWVWHAADTEPVQRRHSLIELSDGGEDAVTVREFDLKRGAFVPHGFALPKGKQSVAWLGRDDVLVAREWKAGDLTKSGYPYIVKRWHRGQPLSAAVEVLRGQPSDVETEVSTFTDAAGHRASVIYRELDSETTEHYLVTRGGTEKLALPAKSQVVELYDGQLLVKLKQSWAVGGTEIASGSLVSLDLAQATAHPADLHPVTVFAPGPRQSIEEISGGKGALLVEWYDNVRGRASSFVRGADGHWTATELALPDNATVALVSVDPDSDTAYLAVTGYVQPSSLWKLDLRNGTPTRLRELPPQFDGSRVEVEQFEAASTDGTKIPYFIVHPKGMRLDGANPTILYAYGGFSISLTPHYSGVLGKLWLEHGGVYVDANIRGGGEFGPKWHDAALKTHRQVAYDDFAAVARDLVARRVTEPRRLGIEGGSNGGLLMGVEMTQHPELWNAVDIQVPLLDMLRFEQIAAGTSWVGEYGSVSVPEQREFLARISPYQNLRRGVSYPRALVWTTTKDDRVGPQHARKFAARLSEYGIPYYYYEVIEGGHASGANLKERAHTYALEFTYFTRQLMDP